MADTNHNTAPEPMDRKAEVRARLEARFAYHPPKGDQQERYVAIRDKAKELAHIIVEHTPYSREQSTALTYLDIAVFNANAAIARNE